MKKHFASKAIQSILVVLALGFVFGLVDESLLFRLTFAGDHRRSVSAITTTTTSSNSRALPKPFNDTLSQERTNDNSTQIHSFSNSINGGVIVFLHIPKTGGTTIRKTFQGRKDVTYLFSNRRSKYEELVPTVDQWVQQGPKHYYKNNTKQKQATTTSILEVHARNNPTLMELCQQLHTWRSVAHEHNIPFFAFTVLREPQSFAISYFNYYHGIPWEPRRFEYLPETEMTDANFQRTMHLNPQCLFLTRSEQAYQRNFPEKRQNFTRDECDRAYHCLQTNMDWIGTTKRLHNETIALLKHLMGNVRNETTPALSIGKKEKQQSKSVANVGPRLFGAQNMSQASLEHLKNMTRWDQIMYDKVTRKYRFEDYQLSLNRTERKKK